MQNQLLFLALAGTLSLSGQSPIQFTSLNTQHADNYRGMYFLDQNKGWATSINGEVVRTSDGGQTWAEADSFTSVDLYDIHMLSALNGFAVGGESGCSPSPCTPLGRKIYKTVDGGLNWTEANIADSEKKELYTICFVDNQTGFAGGLALFYRTLDGGTTWTPLSLPNAPANVRDIHFISSSTGFVCGLQGKLWRTTDGGATWTPHTSGTASHLHAIDFEPGGTTGYIATATEILKTVNGGATWTKIPNSPDAFALECVKPGLFVFGGRGRVNGWQNFAELGYSPDGGATFLINDSISEVGFIHRIQFFNEKTGYAIGLGQNILRLGSISSAAGEADGSTPFRVFPNPTTGILWFDHPVEDLLIFNVLGEIAAQFGGIRRSVDLSDLSPGIYFVQRKDGLKTARIVVH